MKMKWFLQQGFNTPAVIAGICAVTLLSGCDNEFAFKEIQSFCAPPRSSARFGKNVGPIIMTPDVNTPFNTTMTVAGTCVDGFDLHVRGSGVENPASTTCVNGAFSTSITFKTGEGTKELDVAQASMGGDEDVVDRRCFTQDTIPPKVTITGTNGSLAVNTETVRLAGTCEAGLDVIVNGPQLVAPVTTACVNGQFIATVTFTGPDGLKDVEARQIDFAGNNGRDDKQYLTDLTAPLVAITSPASLSLSQGNIILSGTCEAGLPVLLQGGLLSGVATAACPSGAFTLPVSLSTGDGKKTIEASQTDIAGNTGRSPRDFMKDATPPAILITGPNANSGTSEALTLTGTCESGLNITLHDGATSSTLTCAGGTFSQSLILPGPDGLKTLTVTQTDAAGNVGTNDRGFIRDSLSPVVTIDGPGAGTYWSTSVPLEGTCEAGLPVSISGAGANAATSTSCSTGGRYSTAVALSAGDGTKNIVVSQTDGVGNSGTANRDFLRDGNAPLVKINSPAANSYVTATATVSGTCETGFNVTLSGSGLTASSVAACGGGVFSSLVTFTTGDGTKTVTVAQTDGAGNIGSDGREFLRDEAGPGVTIASPAANSYQPATFTLTGSCENGLPVLVGGSGAASNTTATCLSGAYSTSVTVTIGDGSKLFTVSQTDSAGNTGSASRSFERDTTAPVVTITSPLAGTLVAATFILQGTCETGLTVNLSGAGLASLTTTSCAAGVFTASVAVTSGDGSKTVVASQTDAGGNTGSDSRAYLYDVSPPRVEITSPAANSFVNPTATISGTCETGLDVVMSGAGLSANVTTPCAAGAFSVLVSFTTNSGAKPVVATQTDNAGNSDSDQRVFMLDTDGPNVTIASPAANSSHSSALTLVGTCETGLTVTVSGAGAASPRTASCSASTFSVNVILSAGDGVKNLVASQTDNAGNTGFDSRNFNRDSSNPVVTITSPTANSVFNGDLTLQGTCEAGLAVNINGAVLTPSSTNCSGETFSTKISLSNGDGIKNVVVSQTDAAGNSGSANRNFILDTTPPAVAITAPAAGTGSALGLIVSGTCEAGLIVNIDGDIAQMTTTCLTGTFSAAIEFKGGLGPKDVTASQTDSVGNTGSNTRRFIKGNNSNVETFTSRGPGGKVDILFVDDNSASMDAEQQALGTKFSAFTSALSGLDWQAGIVTTDCTANSPHNFCGQLFDLAGRPSGEYILSALTPNYLTAFQNTIQRPETLDCLFNGGCPSGKEEGMKSTIEAFNGRDTYNAGFFRNDSDLAVVYLSDEDEGSNGPANATKPSDVVKEFQKIWGGTKKFSAYGIIVKPGDTACYNSQRTQAGTNANYGVLLSELTTLTGGKSVSICEPDYSVTLTQIGNDVTRLSKSYDLVETPIVGTVSVSFSPAFNTTFTVSGNRVTLTQVPPMGTQISFSYQY